MIYDFKVQQQASALLLAALNKSIQSTAWVIIDCVVNPGDRTQPWSYWTFFTVSSWEGSIDYQVYTDYTTADCISLSTKLNAGKSYRRL